MQLHEKFGNRITAISLNVDFDGNGQGPSEELQRNVLARLTELGIACENVISSDPIDEVLRQFGIFSLPAVLIYDSKGNLHKRVDGSVSYLEQIIPELASLLESRS